MADDLDKFVLQYTVELKDSIQRLEKLQTKMDTVEKSTSKTGKNLKEFASGSAKELDRLVPGLNSIATAVKGLGAEFAIAGAAVGALAIGITSVMGLREQMNAQRADSLVTGLSVVRQEDLTRKLSTQGGGYVSREGAAAGMKQVLEMANESYRNPTDIVRLMKLRQIGINPFDANGNSTSPMEMLSGLAQRLNNVAPDQADALARGAGLDINWARSLRKVGPGGVQNMGMSADDINKYSTGADDVSKLNVAMQEFNNQTNQLKTSIGELTIGPLTSFLKMINGAVSATGKAFAPAESSGAGYQIINGRRVNNPAPSSDSSPHGHFGPGHTWITDPDPAAKAHADEKKQADAKAQKASNDAAAKQDEAARSNVAAQNKQLQLINLFSSAVATFSGAVDVHQAWAAWAGNIGQANGIKGASGSFGPSAMISGGGGNGNWKTSRYSDDIAAAAKAYGLDPQMLYAIMMTESHGKNGQYSSTGAGGLMQVTKGNWKAYGGGGDVMDPAANIMVGARIYKESLDRAKGDVYRGLGYYNGNSDPAYQQKVAGNYGGSSKGIGQNQTSLMLTQVQNSIGAALGDIPQLKRGGFSKEDVQYTADSLEAGYLNSANQASVRLQSPAGLSQIQIADFKNQLLVAQRGLAAMETYKKQIIDNSNGTTSLTAQRTAGALAAPQITNNFVINGAGMTADQLAKAIDDRMQHHMQAAVNSVTNQEKG